MRAARRVGPGQSDLIFAEICRAARRRRWQPTDEPYRRRILRDHLWLWLRQIGLTPGEIAFLCRDAARAPCQIRRRLAQLEVYLHERAASREHPEPDPI
jgi:hypothetical protein